MESPRDFQVTVLPNGDLRPSGRNYSARRGEILTVRELTPEDIRSARQLRYWFGAVIPVFRSVWKQPKDERTKAGRHGRGTDYGKMGTHAALMRAFGESIDTPFGPAYPSSRFKTKREFSRIVDEARQFSLDEFGIPIPTPEEWNGEEAA